MKTTVIQFIRGISDGGAETLLKDYVLLLDKKKFNVIVVCLYVDKNTANYKIMKENNIDIIVIFKKWNWPVRIINRLVGRWYIAAKIKKIVSEHNVEVIHSHMTVLRNLKPISNYLKQKKVRLFYTCHSLPERYFSGNQHIEQIAAEYLIKNNNLRLIGLHPDMVKNLNNRFGVENSIFIRNGIDFNKFRDNRFESRLIREELGIPQDAFVLGHVGRFDPIKNHDFIVDVFQELCKFNSKSFLLLVGSGDEKDRIEKKLIDIGLISRTLILSHRSDVNKIMKSMDVFIFPSKAEGLGIVLIEAQVSGLRCVVSDTVPVEAYLSELVHPLSLSDSKKEWCKAILDSEYKGKYRGDLEAYDMNKEIKRLESLYKLI
jgi:glycosyltransferase involved in cell wall biosynthesis